MAPVRFEIPRRALPAYLEPALGARYTLTSSERARDIPPGHRYLLYFHGMADRGAAEYERGDRPRRDRLNRAKDGADWETLERNGARLGEEWIPLKDGKRHALRASAGMGAIADRFLAELERRASALRAPSDWQRAAVLTAPLVTGSGNPHPVENGFAFLAPYGVPYLAGSAVKGVLRRAAEELTLQQDDTTGWSFAKIWAIFGFDEYSAFFRDGDNEQPWRDAYRSWVDSTAAAPDPVLAAWREAICSDRTLSDTEFLRGLQGRPSLRRSIRWRGLVAFHDAVPQSGATLDVDILNPHHRRYYQGSDAPHDADSPVPVFFLVLAPGARFLLRASFLGAREMLLQRIGDWPALLDAALQHATEWLGFGAKTAVGYGAMDLDVEWEERRRQEDERARKDARLQAMGPEERAIQQFRALYEAEKAAGRKEAQGQLANRRMGLLREAEAWDSVEMRRAAADLIEETLEWLPWPRAKRDARTRELAELRGGESRDPSEGGR